MAWDKNYVIEDNPSHFSCASLKLLHDISSTFSHDLAYVKIDSLLEWPQACKKPSVVAHVVCGSWVYNLVVPAHMGATREHRSSVTKLLC
jgi:hypothetical protein